MCLNIITPDNLLYYAPAHQPLNMGSFNLFNCFKNKLVCDHFNCQNYIFDQPFIFDKSGLIAFRYNLGFNEQMSKIKYELEDLLGDLFTQNTEDDNILLF